MNATCPAHVSAVSYLSRGAAVQAVLRGHGRSSGQAGLASRVRLGLMSQNRRGVQRGPHEIRVHRMRCHRLGRLYSVLFLRHVEFLQEQDMHCEQNISSEADSCSASQEIPHLSYNITITFISVRKWSPS
jgi:hypothetical protein